MASLGTLHAGRGSLQRAEVYLRNAARGFQSTNESGRDLGLALFDLGAIYRQRAKLTDAAVAFRRAIAAWEGALPARHPWQAQAYASLAEVYVDDGRPSEAKQLIRSAIEVIEERMGSQHPLVARMLFIEVRMLRSLGQKSQAKETEQRAKEILSRTRDRVIQHTIDIHSLGGNLP
jgi:tetratricopeptide (TPR) repeat protein